MNNKELYAQQGVAMTCRSFEEYQSMFMLDKATLAKGKILDIAAGASSFTAECIHRGYDAMACDPLYKLNSEQIYEFGQQQLLIASEKLSSKKEAFVWNYYHDIQQHDDIREHSLDKFIESYKNDMDREVYVNAMLPNLPFQDDMFSCVICNHFLFLYQEQFDYSFHLAAIKEMIRVTKKGGIILLYPLVGFKDELYPHLDNLQQELSQMCVNVSIRTTEFRFLPSADGMLAILK
ncbi:class I SAM-dependent methyltransferase [Paenibacillus endoradicis]|uniref:class I SAM-dependent methyltransferase n=1 Tax=Paenibacillus endoradicis TaxID=2972487 RepID=UPI002159932D|nr:class I SAM-dependent methyltransferase [Paenibacillus endoradicis]MCR8660076.1 class I SAM-dependent methyltransferase [Paenibacillus endoradicis]